MPTSKRYHLKFAEHLIVLGIWLVVFTIPLIILREYDYVNWTKVFRSWERIFPFLILFLVNHYILVPYLLFRSKRIAYFSIATVLMGLVFINNFLKFEVNNSQQRPQIERRERPPQRIQENDRPIHARREL